MTQKVQPSPFHARTGHANRENVWTARNGFTLASHYAGAAEEALASRSNAVIADLSWRPRLALVGRRAADMLARMMTRNPAKLAIGQAFKAAWLSSEGGVRGAGVVARAGGDVFIVASAAPDLPWFQQTAAQFKVRLHELTGGGLAVIGRYAGHVLKQASLDPTLGLLEFRRVRWEDIDITISRWGEHGGYELWCKSSDAILVWDRLVRAGEWYGLTPAGVEAMDTLDIEAGVARPERDYDPARGDFDQRPTPQSLGLERVFDFDHFDFNGRGAWLRMRETDHFVLAGLELDSDQSAVNTPVKCGERIVGHTIASCYSPAMRRAIALAQIEETFSEPGTKLSLTHAPTREQPRFRTAKATVAGLPFLAAPGPISP